MDRQEYVQNRPSWRHEYGEYRWKLGHLGEHAELMLRFAPRMEDQALRVLDIGCAYGMHLRYLRQMNPKLELYGVEIARDAAQASERIAGAGRIFWQSCGAPVPLDDASMDVVFSFDMIEHVGQPEELRRMAGEIARLLAPGGVALIETPNYSRRMQLLLRLSGQGHMLKYDHCALFGERELRALLEPPLRVETVVYRGLFDPGPRVPLVRGLFSRRLYLSSHICAVCRRGGAGG